MVRGGEFGIGTRMLLCQSQLYRVSQLPAPLVGGRFLATAAGSDGQGSAGSRHPPYDALLNIGNASEASIDH